MICPVVTDGGNSNSAMFRHDSDAVFVVERRVPALCRHVSTPTLGMCKNASEINRPLRVTRSHPYIEGGGANCFREIWYLIRDRWRPRVRGRKHKGVLQCGGVHQLYYAPSGGVSQPGGVFVHVSTLV